MTTQSLDLNLIPKGISPRLYVSQYDKGQTWTFNIYAGNTAYTIPNGATVTIQGTKPDKTGFQYSCTASGNVVTATEQQQMTVIAGEVPAEIRITNNNEIIATLNFILVVEPAALTDETEISETDLPIIEQAIEMFPHYQEMIDEVSSDIATLSNVRAELGAHNLLKLDLAEIKSLNTDGTWSGNTYTLYGVTFTVNSDYTISTSGTPSENATFYLHRYSTWTKLPLKFLSGCPSGGAMTKYILRLVRGGVFSKNDTGEGVLLDQDDIASPVDVTMVVISGNNVSGLTFKPMIKRATDSDPTYQTYAMTNKELTDVAEQIKGNYVFTGMNSVSVTADGVKNWQTLFNELINSLDSYLSSHTDEYIRITGLLYAGDYTFAPSDYDIYRMYHNSIDTRLRFSSIYLDTSTFAIRLINLSKALASNTNYVSNNGTTTDNTLSIATSGLVTSIYFESYKQIS